LPRPVPSKPAPRFPRSAPRSRSSLTTPRVPHLASCSQLPARLSIVLCEVLRGGGTGCNKGRCKAPQSGAHTCIYQ
ncbi:hypothetical protein CLOP_g9615, partial [Closterium sp. NIES-67]